jgi:outer membrane protein assembly factor BamB
MRLAYLLLAAATFAATNSSPAVWRGGGAPPTDGMARGDAPLKWSATENVAWKVEVPGKGNSSPVIWGDQIFVTTAIPKVAVQQEAAPPPPPPGPPPDGGFKKGGGGFKKGKKGPGGGMPRGPAPVEHDFALMSYDRRDGKLLWKQVATTATPHESHHPRYGSFASNSPVTDGKRVYASFGSRGVYCYDLKGKLVWKREAAVQMRMRGAFGEGTPTVLEDDTLLLHYDHESEGVMVALDKGTGKEKWRVERKEISNWSPPFVVSHQGRKQVVTAAPNKVRSYDFKTGKLIWECAGLGANTIPAPVHIDGIVIVMSGFRDPNLMAIKLGREGDLTGTDSIVWSTTRGTSYTPSPVLHDGKLYMLTDSGMLSCLDAKTGKAHYQQQRLPKPYNFKASPVGVNGKLYLSSEDEDVIVVKMGESFEVLATNTLPGEMFVSSPAVSGGEIFLRSQKTLYCIRDKR